MSGLATKVGEFTATIPLAVCKARFGAAERWEAEAHGLGLAATSATADGAVRQLLALISGQGIAGRGLTDDKLIARVEKRAE